MHSPEPWKLIPMYHGAQPTPDAPGCLLAADDTFIAGYSSDEGEFLLGDPNYQRIVACVNFCREFNTEFLKTHHLKHLTEDSGFQSLADVPEFSGLVAIVKETT